MLRRIATLFVALVTVLAVTAPVAAQTDETSDPPASDATVSADRAARDKLHPRLREQTTSPRTRLVAVTVEDDADEAASLFERSRVTTNDGVGLVLGLARGTSLLKIASLRGVVSITPIELRQTGRPLGTPDEDLQQAFDPQALRAAVEGQRGDRPRGGEPEPASSNFDEILARAPFADGSTHGIHEAWQAGYTGAGVRVGVLDGGTDFGHPDLLGTWYQDDGAWPEAYDPYGTLLWLNDVLGGGNLVEQGLGWYTITTPVEIEATRGGRLPRFVTIEIATQTGPARNFAAAAGTVTDRYRFPSAWTKSGTVRVGSHPDEYALSAYGHRPAVLVTDPNEAGVYDTVYVDMDDDGSFRDEKPITRDSPAAYRDLDRDTYVDLSGGLLYHVSDGSTPLPGGPDVFVGDIVGDPGEILAWTGDFDPGIGGHGTLTASNVAGQGVINGLAPDFDDVGRTPGAVIGAAPEADLVAFGNIYFSFDTSTQIGYYLANLNAVDVTSNSYGSSDVDNDGFDAASQEADTIHAGFGDRSLAFFSTGNGGPGMGTSAPPAPSLGVSTGASTSFGTTGWDSIADAGQVVDNDVVAFSNRGPGANGSAGVDLVADGAYAAGDATLNTVGDGPVAWTTWGGTSRSAPVAAGVGALVYQALGDPGTPGTASQVKSILKSTATDLDHPSFLQGAGSVHAGRAVAAAEGATATVTPHEWRAGDHDGQEWEVFPHVLAPGEGDSQEFAIDGDGNGWAVSDRTMRRTDTVDISDRIAVQPVDREDPYTFNAPTYLADISDVVAEHGEADLLVVRMTYPLDQLDPDGDYSAENVWRLLTYSWTDQDGDGQLWVDEDGDGTVDVTTLGTSSNIDGFPDIDYDRSELDEGEYVRTTYHNPVANVASVSMRDPDERLAAADGIHLGLQHTTRSGDVPVTDLRIQVEAYEQVDWDWLNTSVSAGSATATLDVPGDAAPGMYDGAIVLTRDDEEVVVPVVANVVARPVQDGSGALAESVVFGGVDQSDHFHDNGSVHGATRWGWRAEAGDWRFFNLDLETAPATGTKLLVDTTWDVDPGSRTDLDTLVFGPSSNSYQVLGGTAPYGAPYILDTVGGSQNTNVGAGTWTFDTATGGAREIVTAPASEGLQSVVHHQVLWEGDQFHTPFTTTVGSMSVDPAEVDVTVTDDTGSFDVTVSSSLDLTALAAEAFGLGQEVVVDFLPAQDNPNDPSSASTTYPLTIDNAASLELETFDEINDLDLFLVYDANGDGQFTNGEIIASSASGSGAEFISVSQPEDGDYEVWVQGWSVTDTTTTQQLRVDVVQGTDLSVTGLPGGPVTAGQDVALTVSYDRSDDPMVAGQDYNGLLLLGPDVAPGALEVPITITRE